MAREKFNPLFEKNIKFDSWTGNSHLINHFHEEMLNNLPVISYVIYQ